MSPVYGQTNFTIKKAIARALNDLVDSGTATSGSATALVDTGRFTDLNTNRLSGVNVYIGNGAGQSREVRATAFTVATDTIAIPTGTALDSTSEYMLTRRWTQSDILDAMRRVLWAAGPYALRYVDQSLITGSPLNNATFYDGSGTFPNGWTVSGGTWTQESTISKHGRYSAKVVSNGTDAALIRQDILNIGLYRGRQVLLHGWINTNTTGSRVNILVDDGIDTTTGIYNVTTANRGWGAAEAITAALTVSDRASRLRVSCNVTAGGAVTAYFSGLWLSGWDWREWNVPAGAPSSLHRVNAEEYQEDESFGWTSKAIETLELVEEATKRVRLRTTLPQGRILELQGRTGWVDLTAPTTDDDLTFGGDPEGLIAASAVLLLENRSDGSPEDERRIAHLRLVAAAHGFRGAAIKPPAGSLVLERQP